MEGLICPKCHGVMRNYERSGVTVDQCTECRGIFLDRGELEKLTDAENAHYGGGPQAQAQAQPQPQPPQRQPEYREHRDEYPREKHYGEHHGGGHYGKRKKKSFLDELFD
jgi:Zn-finger nucleic acid-binding protein